jgi:hypothetical protein
MTDPKTRALELCDELEHTNGTADWRTGIARALRSAIRTIGTENDRPSVSNRWPKVEDFLRGLPDGARLVPADMLQAILDAASGRDWQKPETVQRPTKERPIILLLKDRSQFVANRASAPLLRFYDVRGPAYSELMRCIEAEDVLAWRPADSTVLPEDWGTE